MIKKQDEISIEHSVLPKIPSDIEISQKAIMRPIEEIASKLDINVTDLFQFGKYKAKIENNVWKKVKELIA